MNDQQKILDVIRQSVVTVVPEIDQAEITRDRTLSELGCNSIDRAEIVTIAMEELGVVVPVSQFHQGQDLGTIAGLMERYG